MGRHHLYDDSGHETTEPVVFRDALRGWIRELAALDPPARVVPTYVAEVIE